MRLSSTQTDAIPIDSLSTRCGNVGQAMRTSKSLARLTLSPLPSHDPLLHRTFWSLVSGGLLMNPKTENNSLCLSRRVARYSIIIFNRVDKASDLAKLGLVQLQYGHRRTKRPHGHYTYRQPGLACYFSSPRYSRQSSLPSSQAIDVPDLLQSGAETR